MNRQTASRVLAAGLLLASVFRAAGEEAPAPKRAAPVLAGMFDFEIAEAKAAFDCQEAR